MGQAKQRGSYEERKTIALNTNPKVLYRFFETQSRADAFAHGCIWLSTFNECRKYDDPQQGDEFEGSVIFKPDNIDIGVDRDITEHEKKILEEVGVKINGGVRGLTVTNAAKCYYHSNAFLLCTSLNQNSLSEQSDKWNYGIKIKMPASKLFERITQELLSQECALNWGSHGSAIYDDSRYYKNPDEPPQNMLYLKPEAHRFQYEYRFIWISYNHEDYGTGRLINCPDLIPYMQKLY